MTVLQTFDWSVLRWLNASAVRFPVLDTLFAHIMDLRPLTFALLLAALWYFWFDDGSRLKPQELRGRVALTLVSGLAALVIGRLFAEALPFRVRPYAIAELGLRPLSIGAAEMLRSWSSFPSDHATMVFALATGLWLISRGVGALACLVAIFCVGVPRVFMELHFASDVLGGAAIGIVTTLVLQAERIRDPVSAFVLRLESRHGGAFYALLFLATFEIARMFDDIREPVSLLFNLFHRHVH